jgi:enoyl-CoA hydratase/3-hydroxyacyl-CoA dehydrogenase
MSGLPRSVVQVFLQRSREAAALPSLKHLSADAVVEFIFFPVVNEGCRVVAERIVESAADLDIATCLSMGFPAYRGGLMHWADTYGATYIAKRLRAFALLVPSHASFFAPCEYLLRCAAAASTLSAGPPAVVAKL